MTWIGLEPTTLPSHGPILVDFLGVVLGIFQALHLTYPLNIMNQSEHFVTQIWSWAGCSTYWLFAVTLCLDRVLGS